MSRRIITFIAPLLLALFANTGSAANFTIEPVRTDFWVLGYATGSFLKEGKTGCFKVKNAKLVLNKKIENPLEIIGFRLGIAFPVEGTYDYLAQTELFPVNRTLSKERPLDFGAIELCLDLPQTVDTKNQFLSMEIHLKLNNKYGFGTTYAHEKQKCVPMPSK
jgi:hypothetical protein